MLIKQMYYKAAATLQHILRVIPQIVSASSGVAKPLPLSQAALFALSIVVLDTQTPRIIFLLFPCLYDEETGARVGVLFGPAPTPVFVGVKTP